MLSPIVVLYFGYFGNERFFRTLFIPMKENKPGEHITKRVIMPTTNNANASDTQQEEGVWSTYPGGDQSGAVILVALKAHAYAFQRNQTYRGLCYSEFNTDGVFSPRRDKIKQQIAECLAGLNLSNVLDLSCPRDINILSLDTHPANGVLDRVLDLDSYNNYNGFTRPWLEHVRFQRRQQLVVSTMSAEQQRLEIPSYLVSVHVRRGDVSPCNNKTNFRYIPNEHFLDLLDKYIPQNETSVNVTIFSESNTVEPFDDFISRGYHLALDTNLTEVWHHMVQSDLLIMSQSTFSLVPAIFSSGVVIHTPFRSRDNNSTRSYAPYFPHFVEEPIMSLGRIDSLYDITQSVAQKYCHRRQ
jgi:hypothetical protein